MRTVVARIPSFLISAVLPSMLIKSPGRKTPSNNKQMPLTKLLKTSFRPNPKPTDSPPVIAAKAVGLKPT